MSILIGAKVFGDLCLLLCGLGMATLWTGSTAALLAPPALCALSVALGCGERRPLLLRLLCIAPALAGFLWADSLPRLITTAVIVCYAAVVLVLNRYQLEYGTYCEYFGKGLPAVALLVFLSLLFASWRAALVFGALHLVTGVYLSRQLRLGRRQSALSQALNLGALLAAGAGAAALVGALALLSRLGFILGWIWDRIANVLLIVLWGVALAFNWLWEGLRALLALLGLNGGDTPAQKTDFTVNMKIDPFFDEVETHDPTVFIILLVLSVTALALWLLRRALSNMKADGRSAVRRSVTVEKLTDAAPLPHFAAGSPRDRVRQSYRRFLRLLQKKGAALTPSQTTAEIHSAARQYTDEAAARQLRRLYLAARYDPGAQVTAKEAKDAKELLKELEKTS